MGSAGANANLANVSVGVSGSSLWNSNNNAAGNGSAGAVIQDTLHFNSPDASVADPEYTTVTLHIVGSMTDTGQNGKHRRGHRQS